MKTLRWTLLSLALSVSTQALAAEVAKVPGGVVVTPDAGSAKRVRVLVYGPDRFRVTDRKSVV